jgi:hypothetical protein
MFVLLVSPMLSLSYITSHQQVAPGANTSTTSSPTEADLSVSEKEALPQWQGKLVPWTKVKGQDLPARFNEKFKKTYITERIKHLIGICQKK